MTRTAYADAVAAFRLPRLVRLRPNLYAAAFSLMKLLPAWYILRAATERGLLTEDTTVVETTSGTFGLGLAMCTARTGHRLVLVGDPVIDDRLARRLQGLGAEVVIVPEPAATGGFQASRLAEVERIRAELPDTYCPEQYSNPDNPLAYAHVAELLAETLGQVDCLAGPVGSGGSMCGTATHLRSAFPELRAIGVDTHGSVLFGQNDGHRALRGLGNSLLPPNLDHSVFDEVHWLGEAEAYGAAHELHGEHALFMGPTSGAAYRVGDWWARKNPDKLTVVMCPDEGYRYQETVYDPKWLAGRGLPEAAAEPAEVGHPALAADGWASIDWGRRGPHGGA